MPLKEANETKKIFRRRKMQSSPRRKRSSRKSCESNRIICERREINLAVMPDITLNCILSYLDFKTIFNFGLVSRRFKTLADRSIDSRNRITISVPSDAKFDEARRVAFRFPLKSRSITAHINMVTREKKESIPFCCSRFLRTLSCAFGNLRDLRLHCYYTRCSSVAVQRLAQFLPRLRTFYLSDTHVTDCQLSVTLKMLPQLTSLTLRNTCNLNGEWLSAIATERGAVLRSISWIAEDLLHFAPTLDITSNAANAMSEFSFVGIETLQSDAIISLIVEKCSNLVSVEFGVKELREKYVQRLASIQSLRKLKLYIHKRFRMKDDDDRQPVVIARKTIEEPQLSSRVNELSLKFGYQPPDDVFAALLRSFPAVKNLKLYVTEFVVKDALIDAIISSLKSIDNICVSDLFYTIHKHMSSETNKSCILRLLEDIPHVSKYCTDFQFFMRDLAVAALMDGVREIAIKRPETLFVFNYISFNEFSSTTTNSDECKMPVNLIFRPPTIRPIDH